MKEILNNTFNDINNINKALLRSHKVVFQMFIRHIRRHGKAFIWWPDMEQKSWDVAGTDFTTA